MSDREISQEQVDRLVEDTGYLQDEADALQYVIGEVPYEERPSGQRSIVEMLLLIDHAQTSYFRPIFEQAVKGDRPTHLEDFVHFEESFSFDGEVDNIQKILKKISKHRAGVVNAFKNTSLLDWETVIYEDNRQFLLFGYMQKMVHFERGILKEIANRVRIFSQEKQTRREIEQRQKERQEQQPSENSNL